MEWGNFLASFDSLTLRIQKAGYGCFHCLHCSTLIVLQLADPLSPLAPRIKGHFELEIQCFQVPKSKKSKIVLHQTWSVPDGPAASVSFLSTMVMVSLSFDWPVVSGQRRLACWHTNIQPGAARLEKIITQRSEIRSKSYVLLKVQLFLHTTYR